MWTLLKTRPARTLLSGVAVATASGLMLGAALQPDLRGDGVLAPQTLVAGGGARHAAGAEADPGVARYAGHVPDFVIGTDWVKPPVAMAEAPRAQPVEVVVYTSRDQLPEQLDIHPTWRDAASEPVAYPSSAGGVVYETDLPEPPPPPGEDAPD